MSASTYPPAPFTISVHDPKPSLRELHLRFTPEFQQMPVEQRMASMRAYIESMLAQAKEISTGTTNDEGAQRGLMMVIELTEQLLPHIQSDSMPLHETLIVEMGEGANGSSLDELLDLR